MSVDLNEVEIAPEDKDCVVDNSADAGLHPAVDQEPNKKALTIESFSNK